MNVDFSRSSPNTLILLPTLIYIHVLIYRILMHHILLIITITLLQELIIFCQSHSVELWIIVTLLIIICFLIMFH